MTTTPPLGQGAATGAAPHYRMHIDGGWVDGDEHYEAGSVFINAWHNIAQHLPFAGYKQSGNGREIGSEASTSTPSAKRSRSTCPAGSSGAPSTWS